MKIAKKKMKDSWWRIILASVAPVRQQRFSKPHLLTHCSTVQVHCDSSSMNMHEQWCAFWFCSVCCRFFFLLHSDFFFKKPLFVSISVLDCILSASSTLPPPLSESWKCYFCSQFPRSQSLAFIFTFIHLANIVLIASIISIGDCLRKTLAREIQSPACLTCGHVVTLSSSVSQQSSVATAEAAG